MKSRPAPFPLAALAAAAAALAALALSACTSPHRERMPTLAEVGNQPAAERPELDLKLRSGDTVVIRLGGVPFDEINQVAGEYTVDTRGFVNIPGIGPVRADGITQAEFQQAVEQEFKRQGIYSNPTVTVTVPLGARFVNVGGEVRLPQRIPFTPDLTLLSAIAAAGGFTEFASQSRVRLYRGTKFDSVNVRAIRSNPGRDIPLQPGDTIEVFRSFL